MLKAVAHGKDHELIVLGLSQENINRLQKDQPIHLDLKELGIEGIRILLFAGETEDSMFQKIRHLVTDETTQL